MMRLLCFGLFERRNVQCKAVFVISECCRKLLRFVSLIYFSARKKNTQTILYHTEITVSIAALD